MPENLLIVTIVTIFLGSLSQFSFTELATLTDTRKFIHHDQVHVHLFDLSHTLSSN